MKNFLFVIFSIFVCNLAIADVKVVNGIDEPLKINWSAFEDAAPLLSSDESRTDIEFFLLTLEKELSTKDLASVCLEYDTKEACIKFIKKYMDYTDYDANSCTVVSNLIGKEFVDTLGVRHKFNTFSDGIAMCVPQNGFWTKDYKQNMVDGGVYTSDSIYGICENFMANARKCQNYLQVYYTQNSSNYKNKCILELVSTGQMELPVSKMEEKCEKNNSK